MLREKLKLPDTKFKMTFQSRFGPTKWLEPYTAKTAEALARDGTKKVAVITPGFVSDCVETLEEIDLELRETFAEAGGTHFTTVPCLNEADSAISLLEKIAKREISGW